MSLEAAVKKKYKGFALDVSFCSGGGTLGVLGASGSGKSMTLKCIAGIVTPDAGHIEVNGRVLYDAPGKINLPPQKRRVGYLFQSYALFPHMTVAQNLACALSGPAREKPKKIQALLERFSLEGLAENTPGQLSGGQQQRVALARILAYEPDTLLLDEPFSALDAHLKERLQVDMLELLKSYRGDAVLVTHSRDEAYRLCENLLVVEGGRVLAFGGTKAMFAAPRHVRVARITGCKNISRARAGGPHTVQALDWGLSLCVAGDIPEDLTHVGVRAHSFYPAGEMAQNAIRVRAGKTVESLFELNFLFYNAGAQPKAGEMWWKYAKQPGGAQNAPEYLAVHPEDVLLLNGEA